MTRAKCSYADQYQANRPPTCGCEACKAKFVARSLIRAAGLDAPSRQWFRLTAPTAPALRPGVIA